MQNLQCQRARAGAKLPHFLCLRHLQGLRHLLRQRPAKQRCHLGRGDKVAACHARAVLHGVGQGAKFGAAVGVVTQAGRVQRLVHEDIETNPAAGLKNCLADVARERAR